MYTLTDTDVQHEVIRQNKLNKLMSNDPKNFRARLLENAISTGIHNLISSCQDKSGSDAACELTADI